jgi:hypothetical protein
VDWQHLLQAWVIGKEGRSSMDRVRHMVCSKEQGNIEIVQVLVDRKKERAREQEKRLRTP